MQRKRMIYLSLLILVLTLGYFGWKLTYRGAYESAAYSVVKSDGPIEIREYPDLILATTDMTVGTEGNDGSFMRLFKYITGANEGEQKVAMTVPVFMESTEGTSTGQMGFVMPDDVAKSHVPEPANERVAIRQRAAGTFAVIRFQGQLNQDATQQAEKRLRTWINDNGLKASSDIETAGYDPPWTPGMLRRNEVLIRLLD